MPLLLLYTLVSFGVLNIHSTSSKYTLIYAYIRTYIVNMDPVCWCDAAMLAYIDLFIISPLFAWSADTQSEQCVFGACRKDDITKYYDASAACRIYGKWSTMYIWVNMLLWFFKADYTTHGSACIQWFNKPKEVTKKGNVYVRDILCECMWILWKKSFLFVGEQCSFCSMDHNNPSWKLKLFSMLPITYLCTYIEQRKTFIWVYGYVC